MPTSGYSEAQIVAAVQKRLVDFAGFINRITDEVGDFRFLMHVDRLLTNIYLLHQEGKYMSKMQACRLIPAEHVDTCKKYVEEAERLGFFQFGDDRQDRRKKVIVPTDEFIRYVEQRAAASLDEIKSIVTDKRNGAQSRRRN